MEKRIDWIDFAKGFTILFVILHHTLLSINFEMTSHIFSIVVNNMLGMFIATFIMPIFFAISGYLYKDISTFKEYILMIYKKFVAFFIPYFIFNVFILIETNALSIGKIWRIFLFPGGHTWFLYALFLIFVIWGFMDLLRINIVYRSILILVMIFLTKIVQSYSFSLNLTFIFIPYFLLGYILKNYISINYFVGNKSKTISLVLITIFLLAVVQKIFNLNAGSNWTVYSLIPRILLIILFFKMFMVFPKNKLYGFVEKNGKYSIVIFLVHWIIVGNFPGNLCERFFNILGTSDFTSIIVIILSFIIAYIISLFISWLCRYKIVRWIFFPRPFIDPLVKKTKFGKWIFLES